MSTLDPTSNKTFITMTNESVSIFCNNRKYEFSIADIDKVTIAKRRPGLYAFIGNLLDYKDTRYYLMVRTNSNRETKIAINRVQRYFCIKLIAALRVSKHEVPEFV